MAIKVSGTSVINQDRDVLNIVDLTASGAISLNSITFPSSDGSTGQVLQTNGTGTLSFATPSSGVSTGKAIAMAIVFG